MVPRISSSGGPRARQEHGRTCVHGGDAVLVRASCFPARRAPTLDPQPGTSHQGRVGHAATHARDGAGHHRSQAHRRAPRLDPLHGVARATNAAHVNPRLLRHARGEGRPTRRGDSVGDGHEPRSAVAQARPAALRPARHRPPETRLRAAELPRDRRRPPGRARRDRVLARIARDPGARRTVFRPRSMRPRWSGSWTT